VRCLPTVHAIFIVNLELIIALKSGLVKKGFG
jgi:hypothetical protein